MAQGKRDKQGKRSTVELRVGGMYCTGCQGRIEHKLRKARGVSKASVDFGRGTARVSYNPDVTAPGEILAAVESLGYKAAVADAGGGFGGAGAAALPGRERLLRVALTLVVILGLFHVLKCAGVTNLAKEFPLAEEGMGYGLLFVIGLFTSVHCVCMCGGINISQCVGGGQGAAPGSFGMAGGGSAPAPAKGLRAAAGVAMPSLRYNLGRVLGYTAVGAIVGAVGSVIELPGGFKGIVQIVAGIFMIVMGLSMFGVLPGIGRLAPRLPRVFGAKVEEAVEAEKAGGRRPFVVGLLNSLMPCGPLQAMQLYALSTGSAGAGALSMFLFSAGTLPLMFALGAASGALGKKFTDRAMWIGAALVIFLGLFMASNGFSLSGVGLPQLPAKSATPAIEQPGDIARPGSAAAEEGVPEGVTMEGGVQVVRSELVRNRYPAITVKAGVPVKWIIDAPKGSVNGCNGAIVIPALDIQYQFQEGENVIEFTADQAGEIPYSCWMGMIRSTITVEA
ncbi:MAG: sulfite exporter TauE/SafE family protein [Clostridiales Family XIII bacterium]|jgi:sulfite exporter TauE/SafE/copper chaperone CopZ|nr:sulfite exporter TauE/SafE family protein [Clostridiales Family XIII bacterium]